MAYKALKQVTEEDALKIEAFIKDTVRRAGAKGAVLGISGGVDSAVVAKLCADALGGENVLCVFMPTASTPGEDYVQTRALCRQWGIRYNAVSIQQAVDVFSGMLLTGKEAPLEKGNIMARCRMIVLYDKAKKEDYLVAGTTNRSELLMGYMTKYGDGAEDFTPMYHLYKTQVWQMAKVLGVPEEIIGKVPTAGLWEGQTDEDEMGITYKALDLALNVWDQGGSAKDMAEAAGITEEKAEGLVKQIAAMKHKHSQPEVPPE